MAQIIAYDQEEKKQANAELYKKCIRNIVAYLNSFFS